MAQDLERRKVVNFHSRLYLSPYLDQLFLKEASKVGVIPRTVQLTNHRPEMDHHIILEQYKCYPFTLN